MILIFADKVMRVNTWEQVHPDLGGFPSSVCTEHVWEVAVGWGGSGLKVLGWESRVGREGIQSLGVFRQWGQPSSLPMWVMSNSTHLQVVCKLLLNQEMQLLLGQGISVPLLS